MSHPIPLGRQEVNMSVYTKVAAHEACLQDGVVRLHTGVGGKLGLRRTPGVVTRIDEDGTLQLDISVIVRYGSDLRRVGPAIQEAVLGAIRRLSDQPVGQINVYMADIEFTRSSPKEPEGSTSQ
jgi:uncharacterized alkaline shock family protein YloU